MSYSDKGQWGWCKACEAMRQSGDGQGLECPDCGEPLIASARMTSAQNSIAKFTEWLRQVHAEGKSGPSPGGAAAELKCSRANIDMLVAADVLERVEYDEGGHRVIMISQRSIEKAKRNKKETGSWNPRGRDNE